MENLVQLLYNPKQLNWRSKKELKLKQLLFYDNQAVFKNTYHISIIGHQNGFSLPKTGSIFSMELIILNME